VVLRAREVVTALGALAGDALRDDVGHARQGDGLDGHGGHDGQRADAHPVDVLACELMPLGGPDDRETLVLRLRD